MRKKYHTSKLIFLSSILFPSLFQFLSASPTFDYQYTDGNGNRYVLTKEKLITLQYFPIQPIESSSGVYSGGEKKTVFIKQKEYDAFVRQLNPLEWRNADEMQARSKGQSYLQKRKKKEIQFVLFPMSDPFASKIENQLKGYLNLMTTQSSLPPDELIGQIFEIRREESPWIGLTSSYEEEQKGKWIQARALPQAGFQALVTPLEIMFDHQSLLYRSETERQVVINETFFSNLERVDVTRLQPNDSKKIGSMKEPKIRNAAFIIPFLLKGQVLITYWHTNATITCLSKQETEKTLTYFFSGTHTYYTNQKNTSNFKFHITMELDSGDLIVYGD